MKSIAPSRPHPPTISSFASAPRAFRRSLLGWYDAHGRDLPWRHTTDPYRIWVSEIMLQQTRVAAVLEHYRAFFERFPTIQKLAAASESSVLAAWSGLGYYRRARMLCQCAQKIVHHHAGHFPQTSDALRELPGIGRYTAAAIASIAFGEPAAVVDGNVERVLQRLTARALAAKETWELAGTVLEKSRPGDFNQAMMELGATVCLPRAPKCAECPVRKWCATRGEHPRSGPPPQQTRKEVWYALDHQDGQVRLVQRSNSDSLMAGMWELPIFPWNNLAGFESASKKTTGREGRRKKPESFDKAGKSTLSFEGARLSAAPSNAPPLMEFLAPGKLRTAAYWRSFRHSITATNYAVHVVKRPPAAQNPRGHWITTAELTHLPLTGLTRKILRAAGII